MPDRTISIIIPVYRGGKEFEACLRSIQDSSLTPTETIVVIDGDDPRSRTLAESFPTRVIQLETNRGPATARNRGAEIATAEILFFTDADITLHPDTLAKIVDVFEREPEVTALIGSYDDRPGDGHFLSQYKNLFHHYNHQIGSEEASTFWGACGAVRRDIFWQMGGFDETYRRPCIEDIELGYRLKARGFRILLCKDIQVKHLKRWTVYSLLRADFFYRALPWTELIHRDRVFVNDLNLQWSSRFSVVLVYTLLILLIGTSRYYPLLLGCVMVVFCLIYLNIPVYRFFKQKRGLEFAVRSVPWHWLYYLYSGLAFAIGTGKYWLKRLVSAIFLLLNKDTK